MIPRGRGRRGTGAGADLVRGLGLIGLTVEVLGRADVLAWVGVDGLA